MPTDEALKAQMKALQPATARVGALTPTFASASTDQMKTFQSAAGIAQSLTKQTELSRALTKSGLGREFTGLTGAARSPMGAVVSAAQQGLSARMKSFQSGAAGTVGSLMSAHKKAFEAATARIGGLAPAHETAMNRFMKEMERARAGLLSPTEQMGRAMETGLARFRQEQERLTDPTASLARAAKAAQAAASSAALDTLKQNLAMPAPPAPSSAMARELSRVATEQSRRQEKTEREIRDLEFDLEALTEKVEEQSTLLAGQRDAIVSLFYLLIAQSVGSAQEGVDEVVDIVLGSVAEGPIHAFMVELRDEVLARIKGGPEPASTRTAFDLISGGRETDDTKGPESPPPELYVVHTDEDDTEA